MEAAGAETLGAADDEALDRQDSQESTASCNQQDGEDGDELKETKKTSKTSRRNQRRRAQANIAKAVNSPVAAKAGGVLEQPVADAVLEKRTAVATDSIFESTPNEVMGIYIRNGDIHRNDSKERPAPLHELQDGSSGAVAAAGLEVQSPSAACSWQGTSPSRAQRLRIKNQFMDMFRQEQGLNSDLGPGDSTSSKLMTPEELSKFDCKSKRPLVSVHGDIFDVSSNLGEYGPGGERCFQAGTDITWAVVSGSHTKDSCNCFCDIFKAKDDQVLAGRFMNLCSTIVAFQRDYGKPVGRLSIFTEEACLPPPPTAPMEDVCPVQ